MFSIGEYPHTVLVLISILVFFAMRLAVGFWAARQVTNAADYIVAGRKLPIYIASASIMATWFAAEALMGAASTAYKSGFQGVVFDPFGAVLCLVVSGVFFIRLMRRARYLTVVDFFEKRYGRTMSVLASFSQLATYFAWTAAQFVAGGFVLHELLGWPLYAGIIVVGTIVAVYTTMGGMLADSLLDFIQMFFSAAGITVVFYYVLDAVGGWPGLLQDAAARDTARPFALTPTDGQFLGYTGYVGTFYWLAAWMSLGLGSIACQDLMQRSMSAKNEATSVWGTYGAAVLYFVFGIMSPLIGIMMFKLHPAIPDDKLDGLLIMASMRYVPPIITSIFIAALASALMSTSDSSILAGASVITENLVPAFREPLNDEEKLRWTRIMVLAIGAISAVLAIAISNIYRLATISWAILLVGLFVPFACGMYWRRANRTGAVASFLGGFTTWLGGVFYFYTITRQVNTGTDGQVSYQNAIWDAVYISCTPAVFVSLSVMVVVSLLTQRSVPPQPLTDVDGEPLPLKQRLGFMRPRDLW